MTDEALTSEQIALVRAAVADVLGAQELRIRSGVGDVCGAPFPLDETGCVRCGRWRDHGGAHEFRWEM